MQNPKQYVENRINALKKIMAKQNIDAAIIARPENVFYFSNFNPIIISHAAYMVISLKKETCLLVHCLRNDHARKEGAIDNVQLYGKWGANIALAIDPFDAIKELLGSDSIRLGVESDYASLNWVKNIQQVLNVVEFSDISHDISMLKIIKDDYEIDCLRKSARLVDCGVSATIDALDQGATEAQACTEGQYQMRKLWHERYSEYEVAGFASSETAQVDSLVVWCMSNERICYGCDCPKSYVPVTGDLVLPMSWARIGGYAVENERSVAVGELNDLCTKAYDAMLRSRESIFAKLKPGTTFEELYFSAMKVYEDAGFGNILPGRCGHGMGLSTHEFPSLTEGNKIQLTPGMVFTVEPGLMCKDWGGVRHSDTVLVTEGGFERLTKMKNGKIVIKQPA